jgi:hypothetical protein
MVMRITKRHLRRIIRETIDPRELEEPLGGWVGNALTSDPDYKTPDSVLMKYWNPWLEERGLEFEDLDDLANYVGAPDRFTLDARPPVDGMIGPADIEEWAEDQRAAREILSTRAGSYKGTALPGGRKI